MTASSLLDPARVAASSRVNFDKLTPEEMDQRYANLFKELVSLRRKYKSIVKKHERPAKPVGAPLTIYDRNMKQAKWALNKAEFEVSDCNSFLESLVKAIS